jgi:hypothetical protein
MLIPRWASKNCCNSPISHSDVFSCTSPRAYSPSPEVSDCHRATALLPATHSPNKSDLDISCRDPHSGGTPGGDRAFRRDRTVERAAAGGGGEARPAAADAVPRAGAPVGARPAGGCLNVAFRRRSGGACPNAPAAGVSTAFRPRITRPTPSSWSRSFPGFVADRPTSRTWPTPARDATTTR